MREEVLEVPQLPPRFRIATEYLVAVRPRPGPPRAKVDHDPPLKHRCCAPPGAANCYCRLPIGAADLRWGMDTAGTGAAEPQGPPRLAAAVAVDLAHFSVKD